MVKSIGLFLGLMTLDFSYLTAKYPQPNEKIVALDYGVMAGGPATNAAITFQALNNQSILGGSLGQHPLTQLIRSDLINYKIQLIDLDTSRLEPPPVSSILIPQGTGERTVVSINAIKSQIQRQTILEWSQKQSQLLDSLDIILIDGHQMIASEEIAKFASDKNIPIVIDAGSWKPGFELVLPQADFVIGSENFYPPGCQTQAEVFEYLITLGIDKIAITHGEQPIDYWEQGQWGQIPAPAITPVDTLGAGDIFHGAFCHFILTKSFTEALTEAAKIASYSCQFLGTRQWISNFGVIISTELA